MDNLIAMPQMLKHVNLSSIRKAIKKRGTVTRAEIVLETNISSTTVRSLLTEMQEHGEIESMGYDKSSGGRKAERYRFKMDRYYGAAFCIADDAIHYLVVNICGELVESGLLNIVEGDIKEPILSFLDKLTAQRDIKSIGLGVPGIVEGDNYLKKLRSMDFYKVDIGGVLAEKYKVPVVLENDLNAITIGFGRCYEKKFPHENSENTNMAFLHFSENCVSAGFMIGGKIIRGWNNYAGELGLIPMDGQKSLDELMTEPMNDAQYANLVTKIICWICGILNPQYVALGGPAYRKECHGLIGETLYALLPDKMTPEILHSPDVLHDYYEGMAFLTAARIFDEVQLKRGDADG